MEDFLQLLDGVLGAGHCVSDCSRVGVDLVVVTTRERLVSEEVDSSVFGARDTLLRLDML